jgi:acyl dehydratase
MNFMARRFEIDFLRPVRSGDTLTCTMTITELSEAAHAVLDAPTAKPATRLAADAVIVNQRGVAVARVRAKGVIPRPLAEVALDDPRARL